MGVLFDTKRILLFFTQNGFVIRREHFKVCVNLHTAIHYYVRSEGCIVKRAVYIALAIDMNGNQLF